MLNALPRRLARWRLAVAVLQIIAAVVPALMTVAMLLVLHQAMDWSASAWRESGLFWLQMVVSIALLLSSPVLRPAHLDLRA